ncbi:carboxyltransferase domain-containing protein [Nonomuraea sp. B5E05]|uniref:5-oxoprolinase subunit B family protein n=1 Tax=Nonomuraea sp. B5E05 TaxID=3153569 RepID=UPI0032607CE2
MSIAARVDPFGDSAVLVELSGGTKDEVWRATQLLGRAVDDRPVPGVLNSIPTYRHVLIEFDCVVTDYPSVRHRVEQLVGELSRMDGTSMPPVRRFVLPTCYGGEHGPDLESLAASLGLSPAALIECHTRAPYRVRCLAGPIGGPMMDGPDLPAPVPRQRSPRPKVRAGAVLLAGTQGFVKTMDGPGGWQIIGHTPFRLIDIDADPLVPWRPGDEIRFEAITADEWHDLRGTAVRVSHG